MEEEEKEEEEEERVLGQSTPRTPVTAKVTVTMRWKQTGMTCVQTIAMMYTITKGMGIMWRVLDCGAVALAVAIGMCP